MNSQPRIEKINKRPARGESRRINYVRVGISVKKTLFDKAEAARAKYPDPKPSKSAFFSYLISLGLTQQGDLVE